MSQNHDAEAEQGQTSPDLRAYADELPTGCPPDEAICLDGTFYAAHWANPPGPHDFRTAAENGSFKGRDECQRNSNSIMKNIRDARHLVQLSPGRFKYVSEGVISIQHGKVKHTSSKVHFSHHSFWRFKDVTMSTVFIKVI